MAKKTKPKKRKKWTKKELFFIAEYTGKYSNRYLAKKFKVTLTAINNQQRKLNIQVKKNIVGHDYLSQSEFAYNLGLTTSQVTKLREDNIIKSKNLGNIIVIPYEEYERLEDFFKKHITLKDASKFLNIGLKILERRVRQNFLKHQRLNPDKASTIYLNRKEILEYRKVLTSSYTIKEFSELVFYHVENIRYMIKNNQLESFKDIFNNIRIPKAELLKREEFSQKYLTLKEASKLLDVNFIHLRKVIIKNNIFSFIKEKNSNIYINKKDIEDYLKEKNNSYTVKEFSLKIKYSINLVRSMINNNDIVVFKDKINNYIRIPKTELEKFTQQTELFQNSYTVKEFSSFFSCTPRTIRNMIKANKINSFIDTLTKQIRIPKTELEKINKKSLK